MSTRDQDPVWRELADERNAEHGCSDPGCEVCS